MGEVEKTTTSWFGRVGNALAGAGLGLLLVLMSCGLLVWNESRAVMAYEALAEARGSYVPGLADTIDPKLDTRLVYVAGPVTVSDAPEDPATGFRVKGAISLHRNVEMYQWVEKQSAETDRKLGGSEETTTEYSYVKEWVADPVDSSQFKSSAGHENPPLMISSDYAMVSEVRLGAYSVPPERLAAIGSRRQVPLYEQEVYSLADILGIVGPVREHEGSLYAGDNPMLPQVGDIKVTYEETVLSEASVIAFQKGDQLVDFRTSNGNTLFLASSGIVSAEQLFEDAETADVLLAWALRAGGLALMLSGFLIVFRLFSVLGDVVPFLGSLIGYGTVIVSLVLTLVVGSLMISIGWIGARPIVALVIVLAALGISIGLAFWRKGYQAKLSKP